MTTLQERPNTALLVVDVQNGVMSDAYPSSRPPRARRRCASASATPSRPLTWRTCSRARASGTLSSSARRRMPVSARPPTGRYPRLRRHPGPRRTHHGRPDALGRPSPRPRHLPHQSLLELPDGSRAHGRRRADRRARLHLSRPRTSSRQVEIGLEPEGSISAILIPTTTTAMAAVAMTAQTGARPRGRATLRTTTDRPIT